MGYRILVVDDQEASRTGLSSLLASWGHEVEEAADGQEALEKAHDFKPIVVIADLVMPRLDGLGLLKALQEHLPFCMVILLTGHGSIDTAVSAMKEGGYDYLTKPVDIPRLRLLIEKAGEKGAALLENTLLRRRVRDMWGSGHMVGKAPVMQEVYRLIDLMAPAQAPVLVLGESGTGKELVARSIHELSPRGSGPFVAVNCSAFPETLLESEIFGHEKGAFTGALARRAGCFEMAHGGTIFLDEVGEMSPSIQVKFLRVLQDGTLRRLGGTEELHADVRVVAATNKDPLHAIKQGSLREDLYYRLNVCSITLPPLRERKEDIALLTQAFIEEFNAKYNRRVRSVDNESLEDLINYPWPGNVRELRNTIERAIITCESELITPKHLSMKIVERPIQVSEEIGVKIGTTIDEMEKALIIKTLSSVNQNKTKAAQILGISLKTLHNKLHRYGFHDSLQS